MRYNVFMKKEAIMGIGAAVALGVALMLVLFGGQKAPDQGSVSNTEDSAIRAAIEGLGSNMKNVSLLAPDAAAQVGAQYGLYITPELFAAWQADPKSAPGRQTSSPWPDRVEIAEVSYKDATATAQGTVVEVTNDDPEGYAATYPVTIALEKRAEQWLISSWQKGATEPPPERVSVTGVWECLPHKGDGPHTMECAFGIAIDQSDGHYAINTSLMSASPVDFPTGAKVKVEGPLHPAEANTPYDIDGVIWATTIERL
ncbi:MAG: hypothetical protein JWL87_51 [Candidatus Adlerbacteria bacterium]|nr:hypothetical protein [Candidatus Adlerbacteria bacterium]